MQIDIDAQAEDWSKPADMLIKKDEYGYTIFSVLIIGGGKVRLRYLGELFYSPTPVPFEDNARGVLRVTVNEGGGNVKFFTAPGIEGECYVIPLKQRWWKPWDCIAYRDITDWTQL